MEMAKATTRNEAKGREGGGNDRLEDGARLIIYRQFASSQIRDGASLATITMVLPLDLSL